MMNQTKERLGFVDQTSTAYWLVFTSLTLLFVFIRSPMLLSPGGLERFSPPGEAFALRDHMASLYVHLVLIIPWSLLGALQFVPSVRKSFSFQYHRLAGRLFLCLSVGVAASGLSLANRGFGGGFVGQTGIFVLFLCLLGAGAMGYWSIRMGDIPAHRDWMLRCFAYGTSVITLRLFIFSGLFVSNSLGLSSITRCDQLAHVMASMQETLAQYPSCADNSAGINPDAVVAVRGSFRSAANVMAAFHIGYDTGLLLALFIHAAFAELWIRSRYYSRNEDKHGDLATKQDHAKCAAVAATSLECQAYQYEAASSAVVA